jgi:hypothetical protein
MSFRSRLVRLTVLTVGFAGFAAIVSPGPLHASSTGAGASYQCSFKAGDSYTLKFSVGSSSSGRAKVKGTLSGRKSGLSQVSGSYSVTSGAMSGTAKKVVNRKKKKIAALNGIFNENDESLLVLVKVGTKEKQVGCKPKGSTGTPDSGSHPTPTPAPSAGNFDSAGNVTAAGKSLFGIPSNLSANKNTGKSLYDATCHGCHTSEKTNRTFSFIKTATSGSPMFLRLSDSEVANLTAYLNRFRN